MPTRGRHAFANEAIAAFKDQSWDNKELIVVDDSEKYFNVSAHQVRSQRIPFQCTVGLKRNIACELATGKYIMHWDDDDIYSFERIETQINRLIAAEQKGKFISGYHSMQFVTESGHRWLYSGPPHTVVGVSLCYNKEVWKSHPFPCLNIGEDTAFTMALGYAVQSHPDDGRILARIHGGNTSQKTQEYLESHPVNWRRVA